MNHVGPSNRPIFILFNLCVIFILSFLHICALVIFLMFWIDNVTGISKGGLDSDIMMEVRVQSTSLLDTTGICTAYFVLTHDCYYLYCRISNILLLFKLFTCSQEGIPMTPNRSRISPAGSALPPMWVDDVDSVNDCLSDITRLMAILNSMHATRVGTVFGKDLDDMEFKIERMTADITDKFRKAEKSLMKVGAATKRVGGEEATIGANVQRRYAQCLMCCGWNFCIAQG